MDPKKPVMIAGDWEESQMALVDKNGGLTYNAKQLEINKALAKELGVRPMISKLLKVCPK